MIILGVPPSRIDLLNQLAGVDFEDAWERRQTAKCRRPKRIVPILGRPYSGQTGRGSSPRPSGLAEAGASGIAAEMNCAIPNS